MARRELVVALLFVFIIFFKLNLYSYSWQEGELLPEEGLRNPYDLNPIELSEYNYRGRSHALNWPIDVTGALIPYEAVRNYSEKISGWIGLHDYPEEEGEGAYLVPFPEGGRPKHKMGFSILERDGVKGISYSCAACHASNLFGKKIIGLTNRFPGANTTFVRGKFWSKKISPKLFRDITNASPGEVEMYRRTRNNLRFVESKRPAVLGLDTSLAHTALSLSRRAEDEYATKDIWSAQHPRKDDIRSGISDSKPAVWWNVKYKNRWLLDGSVVSGNPILTNIIWNEIGRGTDLRELETWISANEQIIQELTAAVYNSEPPRITDFFPPEKINLKLAKKGETLFLESCTKCHGQYQKKWSEFGSEFLPLAEQLKTTHVFYFRDTPVKDVGTDRKRRESMKSLLPLNKLKLSNNLKVKIEVQAGYVPPPLEGIWSRYPYLHNNSIPNLCELFKPAKKRVKFYWSGEALNPDLDFDFACNGYPVGVKTPKSWQKKKSHYFDASRPGLSNQGHDRGFDKLSDADRTALIQFLQTL